MTTAFGTTVKEKIPECFGKQWDASVPECAGGPDPDYTHPRNGSHVREQCSYFSQCGIRVQAQRSLPLLPANSLARPGMNGTVAPANKWAVPTQPAATTFQELMRQAEAQRQAMLHAHRAVPVASGTGLQYPLTTGPVYPAPAYHLNYLMPAYLTVPEFRHPGESMWGLLIREVLRAMFKSTGHTISHFFDTNPFRLPVDK